MTDADRDKLRTLQDAWLALPVVQNQTTNHGWDHGITEPGSPTFAQVRDMLYPAWEGFFRDMVEGET